MISWPHGIRSLNSQFNLEWRQVNWIINKAPMANLYMLCSGFWLNMTRWRMLSNKVKQRDGSTCIEISLGMWRPGPFNTYIWINIPSILCPFHPIAHVHVFIYFFIYLKFNSWLNPKLHMSKATMCPPPPPKSSWLPAMMPMHMLLNTKDHLLQRDWTTCS